MVEEFLRDDGITKALVVEGSVVFEKCSRVVRRVMDEDFDEECQVHGGVFGEEK